MHNDNAGKSGANHLFLVNKKGIRYFDCNEILLPFGEHFTNDILNRTETSMTQSHCFPVTELALKAQKQAQKI